VKKGQGQRRKRGGHDKRREEFGSASKGRKRARYKFEKKRMGSSSMSAIRQGSLAKMGKNRRRKMKRKKLF